MMSMKPLKTIEKDLSSVNTTTRQTARKSVGKKKKPIVVVISSSESEVHQEGSKERLEEYRAAVTVLQEVEAAVTDKGKSTEKGLSRVNTTTRQTARKSVGKKKKPIVVVLSSSESAPESPVSQAIPFEPEQLAAVSSVIAVGTNEDGHSFRRKVNGAIGNCYRNLDDNTFAETRTSASVRPPRYEAISEQMEKFEDWVTRRAGANLERRLSELEPSPTTTNNEADVPPSSDRMVGSGGRITCAGNVAFKCPLGSHKDLKCPAGSRIWHTLRRSLLVHSYHLQSGRKSAQRICDKLQWKVCELAGILEITSSPTVVRTRKYEVVKGPFCNRCERHVHYVGGGDERVCDDCYTRVRKVLLPTVPEYPSWPERSWNSRSTLVFLCARLSGNVALLPKTTFANLKQSVQQSERNPGPFRNTNRPGFPSVMRFMGKFASYSNANCPIHMMSKPTKGQSNDIHTLNLLADAIVNSYVAGDTVIIGINQPTTLSICHLDMEAFIAELFQRGISEKALYFYCYSLRSKWNVSEKYETVVLAAELREAILSELPRYGVRPAVSGYLHAMAVGVSQCQNRPPIGRNVITTDEVLTISQAVNKIFEQEESDTLHCGAQGCGDCLSTTFSLTCSDCSRWFHGNCVNITEEMTRHMHADCLEWVCCVCTKAAEAAALLKEGQLSAAVAIYKESGDFTNYGAVCLLGSELNEWSTLVQYLTHFFGRDSDLDFHCLYALVRIDDFDRFCRLIRVTDVSGELLTAMADCLDEELGFPNVYSNFIRYQRTVAVTPVLQTPPTPSVCGDVEALATSMSSASLNSNGGLGNTNHRSLGSVGSLFGSSVTRVTDTVPESDSWMGQSRQSETAVGENLRVTEPSEVARANVRRPRLAAATKRIGRGRVCRPFARVYPQESLPCSPVHKRRRM